ncbi:MAG: hypothetical protein PF486_05170 [Prolixibacteraceae bacterium]|jgi:regulator of cell morphogenesis and NO signaling|nr:hypothetical protein [Prolixibacteraceae bacterium]
MKHLPIYANMKLADAIHLNYLLLPIIGRFGIELGFGNKTIKEICDEKEINLSFFLEIVNSYHNKDYFASEELQNYSLTLVVRYLISTHHYYIDVKIPELEEILNHFLENSSNENKSNNTLITNFFEEYKNELINHLKQEERTLFPYTFELEEANNTKIVSPALINKINNTLVEKEHSDHHDLEEKLFDLKNLIIKFLPPVKRKDILEKLLIELFRLEEDLEDHSRIEEQVLVPKIIQLEKIIIAQSV